MIVRELLSVFGIDFDDAGQKKADAALKGLQGQATIVGQTLSQLSGLLAGSAIFGVFTHAADAAARLAGHVRRTNAMFGEGAGAVHAWSQSMGQTMGRSEGTLLGLANAMKPVADGMTESDEEAAKMSTTLAELAVNMGAFFGETDEEALGALRMGMMGMDRQLKKYGIQLNDESLAEFARSKGLRSNVKDMKESEKAHLRYLKILESTTKYQGAAQKALERYSGAKKRLSERVEDLWEAMGKSLLPVFAKVFTVMSTGIERFLAFAENTNLVEGAMMALAIVGGALLLPTLIKLLATVGPFIVGFALFAFIMDDVITAFQGGNSVLRTFGEYLDELEKKGFPGQGAAMETLIKIFNRFRDVVGSVMLMVSALFEAIATGSLTPIKQAVEGLGVGWKDILGDWKGSAGGAAAGLPSWVESALGWAGIRKGGGLPQNAKITPSAIDTGGLASRQVQVQAGDQTVTIQVTQEPGESSEDFAQRVAEIVQDENAKRDEDLYTGLVQTAPVTP